MPTINLSTLLASTNFVGYTGSAATAVQGYTGSTGGAGLAGNVHIAGNTFFNGNLLPTANNTVNLGSPSQRFGTLYISANTIDIGGATISGTGETIQFTTDSGNVSLNSNTISFLSNISSQGPEGARGYTGSAGINGYTGSIGSTGYTGSQGSIGYTGSSANSYVSVAIDTLTQAFKTYIVDTTSGNVSLTLPETPSFGDTVGVIDGAGSTGTNQITVIRNGSKIQGSNSDLVVNNSRAAFTLVYFNAANGWVLTSV